MNRVRVVSTANKPTRRLSGRLIDSRLEYGLSYDSEELGFLHIPLPCSLLRGGRYAFSVSSSLHSPYHGFSGIECNFSVVILYMILLSCPPNNQHFTCIFSSLFSDFPFVRECVNDSQKIRDLLLLLILVSRILLLSPTAF